jgi:very-short-patch-repair endonuclease
MTDAWRVKRAQVDKPSTRVAQLAARERGVLTVAELRACGLSRDAIRTWVRNGHLHEKHRGVYAVGHREISVEARWLAAVKACGPDAVLSHYAAAALWGLVRWDGRPPEVTIPTTQRRAHPGMRVHRTAHLERTLHNGIPVTSPLRTLEDLSSMLPFKPLRRAVREAYFLRLITTKELATAKSRALRKIAADIAPTRNDLEDAVLDLIKQAGFEDPDVNVALGEYVPDFRWAHRQLIIEADGAQAHDHDLARADDARREARLEHRVVRVSWKQAVLEPSRTLARLRAEEFRSRAAAPLASPPTSSPRPRAAA